MNEAPKHTPGPWRAVGGDELVFVSRPNIAHVGVTGGRAHDAPFVIVGNPGPKGSEEADARLIAAAPEMLAVLRDALELANLAETLTGCRGDDDFVAAFKAKVEAAISKAEGRP
jgi:hypothetical protein